MVAMLVKLLLVLIAKNTSPATSLEVSFSRSKYALCYKRFSFNFFHLSFVLFFSLRLSIDGNLLFRFIRVVASLFEVACSKHSDSGQQCEVKKAIKRRRGLGREVRESL